MRRRSILLLVPLVALGQASEAFAQNGSGDPDPNPHDCSAWSWCDADPCSVCHFAPDTLAGADFEPTWSHALTTRSDYVFFQTVRGTPAGTPQNVSALCMGCHDGVTPMNDFVGNAYSGPDVTMPPGPARFGNDLTEHHPLSLELPTDALYHASTTLAREGRIECTSCHDPHGVPGAPALLVMDNRGDAICFECHNMDAFPEPAIERR
jgi:predicted CXXCH cytochrome family protein